MAAFPDDLRFQFEQCCRCSDSPVRGALHCSVALVRIVLEAQELELAPVDFPASMAATAPAKEDFMRRHRQNAAGLHRLWFRTAAYAIVVG